MAVGDGQPHHRQHIGHHEEDDLIDMIQQGFRRITIWPNHQASCSCVANILLIVDGGGVEEGRDGHQDAHHPDDHKRCCCGLQRKVRRLWPHNGQIPGRKKCLD